jgi:hypothetical protein
MKSRATSLLISVAIFAACAEPSPHAKDATGEAAQQMERNRCSANTDETTLLPVLSGSAIERVEPLYANIDSTKSGNLPELQGAMIQVRPAPGMTGEWLDRALECHSAERVLGQIPPSELPNDPFWLPGNRTVDIDARAEHDVIAVAVRGANVADAHEILRRAVAFHTATAPMPPSPPSSGTPTPPSP